MWKEELPEKFVSWMLYPASWAKENITTEAHVAQVSVIKAKSIAKFASRCDGVIARLEDSLRAWKMAGSEKRTRFHKYPFVLKKDDLQVIIFAMREYLTFLEYEERKFDRYVEEDWDSDDRCGQGEDRIYVSASLEHLEDVYEKLSGSEFFDW